MTEFKITSTEFFVGIIVGAIIGGLVANYLLNRQQQPLPTPLWQPLTEREVQSMRHIIDNYGFYNIDIVREP